MHAEHADAPSMLTSLWARGALGQQVWRFAWAPGHTGPIASADVLTVQSVTLLDTGRYRTSILPPVCSRLCAGARTNARSAIAGLLTVTRRSVNVFGTSACSACIALPYLRETFLAVPRSPPAMDSAHRVTLCLPHQSK
jgi:hypothetical protein